MDYTLTDSQKKDIKKFIESQKIKAVEKFDFTGRAVKYASAISGKKINEIKGDEEITRACLLTKLSNEYGYDLEKMEIEHEYTAGRPHTNTSIIDLIVRDNNGDAFLFIELKSPNAYANEDRERIIEEQLFKVAAMEQAEGRSVKYLMLYTIAMHGKNVGDECIIIDREKYPTFKDWEPVKEYGNVIPKKYGKAQKIPYVKGSAHDLQTNFTHELLNSLQVELHNVLWGGGGTDDNDVFSSLTNLILAKIQDEDEKVNGDTYDFQSLVFVDDTENYESLETLFERINNLYRRALKEKLNVTDNEEIKKSFVVDTKKFSLEKVKFTVQTLEGYSLIDGKNSVSGKDILGGFFEGIIRDGFKQTKGQFFTHINIVRFMLWAIQADRLAIDRINADREIPYMIDPSAGSGTFLIEYMKFITANIKYRFKDQLQSSRAVEDKCAEWFYPNHRENKWAREYIYGSELNFNLGTATKVNMILHGDGATNIFVGTQKGDGLLPFNKYIKSTAPNALNKEFDDPYYPQKVNSQFDLILTNPPFSVDLDNDTKRTIKKSFVYGDKKKSENLFIERWYQLLRENGRLAAVLPESVFDTNENRYIRLFIYKYFKIKAVVSLPQLAFVPYTPTKTSILFAQKKTSAEIDEWNQLWDEASKEYARIKIRVENIIAVYDGTKEKAKLPSIKDLSEKEEEELVRLILKSYLTERDDDLDKNNLIDKYRESLEEVLSYDKDLTDTIGYVNPWWVFQTVSNSLNYDIFMAEVDNVGYKRTKRGEKDAPNELFSLEYAPYLLNSIEINDNYKELLNDITTRIKNEEDKKRREKKQDKIKALEDKIAELVLQKAEISAEYKEIKSFIKKYYKDGKLKDVYADRMDAELVKEFKSGRLKKYCSYDVLLRENEKVTVLDYMRELLWD